MKNSVNNEHQRHKQRLYRIKTQHDESANINKDLLYEQTKNLHINQIKYAIYADSKSDELFPLKTVDIGFVQSLTLKDDPKFKEVRHLLHKYNQEVLIYDQKSALGLHLKTKVIDSMLKFMRLMMQAPDATAKKRILDVAYYWFKKNLDSQKGKKRTKKSLEKQIRTILLESNLVPKSAIQKQLPSQKRKQQLYDYMIRARTKYPEINAPAVQLENFVTHKLGFVNQTQKNEGENDNANKTIEELRQQKWKRRVIFKRPYIEEPNYDQPEDDRMLQNGQMNAEGKVLTEKTQNNNVPTNVAENRQKPPGQQPNAQNPNQPQQQQLDMGIPQDPNEAQDPGQHEEQDPKDKRGKLDPLVKIFLKDRQRHLKTQGQISVDKRYNLTQNSIMEGRRLDQINAKFVTQWAGTRSRFKSQLSRKIQSIRTFTSVSKAKEQVSLNKIRVENTIAKAKLNQTLKQYGAYINHETTTKDPLNIEQSMSVFDKKRANTEVSSTMRAFSSVLEDNRRIEQKSQYLQEIHRLKQKFAKYKLYTPLQNFKKAIIHPQQKQCNWAQLDKQLSEGIQLPRCQMLSNPFFKVAKKKKKKGKKK